LAVPLKSLVLLSLKVPVAVSCCVCDKVRAWDEGVTESELSVGLTKKPRQPAAKASSKSVANPATSLILQLESGMIWSPGRQAFPGIVRDQMA
jgi:hypothetical protein